MFDKRRTGANTDSGTAGEEDFLKSERAVVVVGEVGTGAGLAGGGEEFFAFVLP